MMRQGVGFRPPSAVWVAIGLLAAPCFASKAPFDPSAVKELSQAGYSADSIDGLILATEDHRPPFRFMAATLLAQRYGENRERVLPVLRKLWLDQDVYTRATAAYWAAKLGDEGGKEILERTYHQLVPAQNPQQFSTITSNRLELHNAIRVGGMLAEFGNPVGAALAQYVVNDSALKKTWFAGAVLLGRIACLERSYPEEATRAIEAMASIASSSQDPLLLNDIFDLTLLHDFPSEGRIRLQGILEKSDKFPAHLKAMLAGQRQIEKDRARRVAERAAGSQPAGSRPAYGTRRQRRVHLEPPELEMPISHRESRVFRVALQGGPASCVVKEVLTDDPGIEASAREEPDKKSYTIDVTVKETTMQNRTYYVVVRLEGCERPFVVLPIKFFRQVTSRPASGPASAPASKPASRPE